MTTLSAAPGVRVLPAAGVFDLDAWRAWDERPAVLTADSGVTTYAGLAGRVTEVGRRLGDTRRLVQVEGGNSLDALVGYLAALTHGHAVLLTPPGRPAERLAAAWHPDVVIRGGDLDERRPGTRHTLHPELALLSSTSGSTGAPKLVRLSYGNLASNAESIARYLGLGPQERPITSLPLHYCYGLSVVHSHLLVGAALVLTELSVADDCFWRLARRWRATSFAGVPHTFELIERSGRARLDLPDLRYVTQAGGRMCPDRVRAWADRGRDEGFDLVVMYGQTEATARMAWLPPELAGSHPHAIGIPIPGGSLRVAPVAGEAEPGVGELVYAGPNVMLGHAEHLADLARGPEHTDLRTGDLGREVDGVFEIVGRLGRRVKVFGLRLDLDLLESTVPGIECVAVDDVVFAFTTRPRDVVRLQRELLDASGLPRSAVRVVVVGELPRTASGKVDRDALARHAAAHLEPVAASVRDEYAVVLGRPDATERDTFVSLGGDSLSYVELATRLGARLGELPRDWPSLPISAIESGIESEPSTAGAGRRRVRLDSSVLIRALAIVAVVGSHADLWTVMGGAHVLLAVAGFNFARFQLAAPTRADRVRHGLASVAQLLLPAVVWMAAVTAVAGSYRLQTMLMLNGLLGSDGWTRQWQYWFLEALVWMTAGALALLAVPALDRLERRSPYGFALGLVTGALAVRFAWVGVEAGPTERYTVGVVGCWFLIGWLAARADSGGRRWTVVLLAAAGTVGFFGDPVREALVVAGVAFVAWIPSVPVPGWLLAPVSVVGSASLFIYVTHWQVYPPLEVRFPVLATVASVGVGVAYWWLWRPVQRRIGGRLRALPDF